MPCFSQQLAVRMPGRTQNGKQPLKFIGKAQSYHIRYGKIPTEALLLPCRQCIGCRLEKSRQWATRLMHEVPFHKNACFLTLTYDDHHVPENGTLVKDHLSKFIKDLRARCDYQEQEKIKYFACGEYGEKSGRPHYHLALYGPFGTLDPDDQRTEEEPSRSGDRQFSHSDIASVWQHGRHRFSDLSFESAAYVARYVLKKISGISAEDHYGDRIPEFQRASNGLGKSHTEKWASDLYPSDQVVLPGRGAFMPPPYYDRLLEKRDPSLFAAVKKAREEAQEKLTKTTWLDHVNERDREGQVRTLVTEQTLIRSL